jgi:hypothetical protein
MALLARVEVKVTSRCFTDRTPALIAVHSSTSWLPTSHAVDASSANTQLRGAGDRRH